MSYSVYNVTNNICLLTKSRDEHKTKLDVNIVFNTVNMFTHVIFLELVKFLCKLDDYYDITINILTEKIVKMSLKDFVKSKLCDVIILVNDCKKFMSYVVSTKTSDAEYVTLAFNFTPNKLVSQEYTNQIDDTTNIWIIGPNCVGIDNHHFIGTNGDNLATSMDNLYDMVYGHIKNSVDTNIAHIIKSGSSYLVATQDLIQFNSTCEQPYTISKDFDDYVYIKAINMTFAATPDDQECEHDWNKMFATFKEVCDSYKGDSLNIKSLIKEYKSIYNKTVIVKKFECFKPESNIEKLFITLAKKSSNANIRQIEMTDIDNIKFSLKLGSIKIPDCYQEKFDSSDREVTDSCEFFTSVITMTNWLDELQNKSVMGLMLSINTNNIVKNGFLTKSPKFNNISTAFISLEAYLEMLNDKTKDSKEIKLKNTEVTSDVYMGKNNAFIPLYINKDHWKVTKVYIKPILSLCFADNPVTYNKNYENLLFILLTEMTRRIFLNQEQLAKHKEKNMFRNNCYIRCYFAVLRTCFEISIDRGYNRGVNNFIRLLNTKYERENYLFNVEMVIGQMMSSGFKFDDNTTSEFINTMTKITLKQILNKKQYTVGYINYISKSKKPKTEFANMFIAVKQEMLYWTEIVYGFVSINKIIRDVVNKFGSYNKFIKSFDASNSFLDEEITVEIIKSIQGACCEEDSMKCLYSVFNQEFSEQDFRLLILTTIKEKDCRKTNKDHRKTDKDDHSDNEQFDPSDVLAKYCSE